eukprot:815581-Lingulodinium_polyedra.AAC.1
MSAIKFFAENHLHLAHVIGARVGIGLRELPTITGIHGAVSHVEARSHLHSHRRTCSRNREAVRP